MSAIATKAFKDFFGQASVEKLSAALGDPAWLRAKRLAGWEAFQRFAAADAKNSGTRWLKAADKAVETLRALLDAESDTVKLGASRAILDGLLRFQESEVLAERVRKLEGRQDAVRTYLANLTGEEVESFFFELKASVEGTRKP